MELFKKLVIACAAVVALAPAYAVKVSTVQYKHTDELDLTMKVFAPDSLRLSDRRPAIVFFFGGGWITRSLGQFEAQARYFAERGMVCFVADYRVKKTEGTSPYDCVADAKSAIRYVRSHAAEFGVDPDRIAASGGSAGGHIAAATAMVKGYDDPSDDRRISPEANLLVLFNPVLDNGPGGYGYERIGKNYKRFSPSYNVRRGVPHSIIFLGEKDTLFTVQAAERFKTAVEQKGSECELHIYPGVGHGFFNRKEYKQTTMLEAERFLKKHGYLE